MWLVAVVTVLAVMAICARRAKLRGGSGERDLQMGPLGPLDEAAERRLIAWGAIALGSAWAGTVVAYVLLAGDGAESDGAGRGRAVLDVIGGLAVALAMLLAVAGGIAVLLGALAGLQRRYHDRLPIPSEPSTTVAPGPRAEPTVVDRNVDGLRDC